MKIRPSKKVYFGVSRYPPRRKEGQDDEQDRGDLLQRRGEEEGSRPAKFKVVIFFSLTFYVADLCLDLFVCAVHFLNLQPKSGWFIFFCILLPNLYAGYKSLQWYLRAHEQYPIRRPSVWIVRVLFFPISPILRYIDAWVFGRRARRHWKNKNYALEQRNFENYLMEIAEVALLRLVIIFLEDAPIVVLNLAHLLRMPPTTFAPHAAHAMPQPQPQTNLHTLNVTDIGERENGLSALTVLTVRLGSVVAKLTCTMTLGVVHYVSCNKLAWHLAHTQQQQQQQQRRRAQNTTTSLPQPAMPAPSETKGVLSWGAEGAIYCWQLLAIGSRVVAYALLWVVHFDWLWLPILVRWLLHALWIYFDVAEMSLVNSIAFGGVYLFSFVTTSPGRQVLRIVLYYVVTLAEHVIIALLFHYGDPGNPYHDLGIGILFGGAGGGLVFLALYYGCCHPDRSNVWLRVWWRERRERKEMEARREYQ